MEWRNAEEEIENEREGEREGERERERERERPSCRKIFVLKQTIDFPSENNVKLSS